MLINFGTITNPTGDEDPAFALFWKHYPRHEAKLAARRVWYQLRPDRWLIEQIIQALTWQVKQLAWQEDSGKYVPRADRWLRDGRWLDEKPKAAAASKLDAYTEFNPKWAEECYTRHGNACANAKEHAAKMQASANVGGSQ